MSQSRHRPPIGATPLRFHHRRATRRATRVSSTRRPAAWPLVLGEFGRLPTGGSTHHRSAGGARAPGGRAEPETSPRRSRGSKHHRSACARASAHRRAPRTRCAPLPAASRPSARTTGPSPDPKCGVTAHELKTRIPRVHVGSCGGPHDRLMRTVQRSRTVPVSAAYRRLFGWTLMARRLGRTAFAGHRGTRGAAQQYRAPLRGGGCDPATARARIQRGPSRPRRRR